MYVVLGATGHVGSGVVEALRPSGERIFAVVHSAEKAAAVAGGNVEAAVVDVRDSEALRAVLRKGRRAFLLNPPARPDTDTNAEEIRTARSIAAALSGSGLEKVVVQSTYGAQQGEGIGDLSVLYAFERLVEDSGIPTAINRAAYYFTNLDILLDPAKEGVLPTAFPGDFVLPMVAPADLGRAAATRLTAPIDDIGVHYVEGPERYTFADVAAAFAARVGRPVEVQTTPRPALEASFRDVGFSPEAARSYARMTQATIDDPELPAHPRRGDISLTDYIAGL